MRLLFIILFTFIGCKPESPDLKRVSNESKAWIVQYGLNTSFPWYFYTPTSSYAQPYQMTREGCNKFKVDAEGNMYCAGFTNHAIGDVPSGGADVLIVKFGPYGQVIWATQLGEYNVDPNNPLLPLDNGDNGGEDNCFGIDIDKDGNVYCVGYTSLNIGGAGINPSSPQRDPFLLKLNKNGVIQWVEQIGTVGVENFRSVKVFDDGTVFCLGDTTGEFVMGERPDPDGAGPLVRRTDEDIIVVKFSSDGTELGRLQLGEQALASPPPNMANLISVTDINLSNVMIADKDENLWLIGNTLGNLADTNPGPAPTDRDIFIWKIDKNLNTIFIKQYPFAGSEIFSEPIVNSQGNMLVAGWTTGDLAEQNGGSLDVALIEFSQEGEILRSSQLGAITRVPGGDTSKLDAVSGITSDREGSIYVTGQTSGAIGEANGDPLNATTDMYIGKWDRNLNFITAIQLGAETTTPGGDNGFGESPGGIHIDYFGNLYVAGTTSGALGEPHSNLTYTLGPFYYDYQNLGDIFFFRMDMSTLELKPPRF